MTNIAQIKDRSAFRKAIREWIATVEPYDGTFEPGREGENPNIAIQRWWMKKRAEVGLAIPHWPKAFGGEDLDMGLQVVMMEEFARGRCPSQHLYIVSLNHIPVQPAFLAVQLQQRRTRQLRRRQRQRVSRFQVA